MDPQAVLAEAASRRKAQKLTRKETQAVKMQARYQTNADQVTGHRDGSFTARWGYFYRHGQTPEGFAKQVMAAFGAGTTILSTGDHYVAWPKNSYFWVHFRVTKEAVTQATTTLEGLFADWAVTWKANWEETRDLFQDYSRTERRA